MARRVFFSFHFKPDNWRASQIRNIGVIEGNAPISDNEWECVVNKGEAAIQNWIDSQLDGKSCTIVLIGTNTSERKWIDYEIIKSWNDGKGLLGIYIHNLKDRNGNQSQMGNNPFEHFAMDDSSKRLSDIVKIYTPPYIISTDVYNYIKDNIEDWVETAIDIRSN